MEKPQKILLQKNGIPMLKSVKKLKKMSERKEHEI